MSIFLSSRCRCFQCVFVPISLAKLHRSFVGLMSSLVSFKPCASDPDLMSSLVSFVSLKNSSVSSRSVLRACSSLVVYSLFYPCSRLFLVLSLSFALHGLSILFRIYIFVKSSWRLSLSSYLHPYSRQFLEDSHVKINNSFLFRFSLLSRKSVPKNQFLFVFTFIHDGISIAFCSHDSCRPDVSVLVIPSLFPCTKWLLRIPLEFVSWLLFKPCSPSFDIIYRSVVKFGCPCFLDLVEFSVPIAFPPAHTLNLPYPRAFRLD